MAPYMQSLHNPHEQEIIFNYETTAVAVTVTVTVVTRKMPSWEKCRLRPACGIVLRHVRKERCMAMGRPHHPSSVDVNLSLIISAFPTRGFI
ncbi:hypothetical protein ACLB2K_005473 [Fragaria x ananassa]